jgi:hypothetical protein
LTGGVIIASVLPGISLHDPRIADKVNSGWVHFLVYMVAAALPVLGWKFRTGLPMSAGLAILSVVLQSLHGFVTGRGNDSHDIVINLLGIASGILLASNILVLRGRGKARSSSSAERSKLYPRKL